MNRQYVDKQKTELQEEKIPLLVNLPNQRKSPNRNNIFNMWRVFSYHMGNESLNSDTPAIPELMQNSILLRSSHSYDKHLTSHWEKPSDMAQNI